MSNGVLFPMGRWSSGYDKFKANRALVHGRGSKKLKKMLIKRGVRREGKVDALVAKRQALGS